MAFNRKFMSGSIHDFKKRVRQGNKTIDKIAGKIRLQSKTKDKQKKKIGLRYER